MTATHGTVGHVGHAPIQTPYLNSYMSKGRAKMRVCHECGAIDPPEWKHVKWSYYLDACSFENFKILHPKLVNQLLKGRMCEDKNYVYRLSKTHKGRGIPFWVTRKAKIDFGENPDSLIEKFPHMKPMKKHLPTSHVSKDCPEDFIRIWNRLHPSQTKLLEVTTNK